MSDSERNRSMGEVVRLDTVRNRQQVSRGPVRQIEVTTAYRRSDGALIIGHDPARLRLCAGILVVMAIVGWMWWSAHFRGIGPMLLFGLLILLAAMLVVSPSRLVIDREAGVLRLDVFGFGGISRRTWPTSDVAEVTLVEWQHPDRDGSVDTRCETVIRLRTGEVVALQDPRNAKGYDDSARLRAISAAIRRELATDPLAEPGPEQEEVQ